MASDELVDRTKLAAQVAERCRLEGEFTLRSGIVSNTYFDKYVFEADPELLLQITLHLVPLVPSDTEVLAGLELGGVPLAVSLARETGLPACFVRKEAKSYGTAKLAEGADIDGRKLLVVEDVITTGGQVARSTRDLRARGAIVDTVLCVIDRRTGGPSALDDAALDLRALFTLDDLVL